MIEQTAILPDQGSEQTKYSEHLKILRQETDEALATTGYNAVIFAAGPDSHCNFDDDHGPQTGALAPHFARRVPASTGGHFLTKKQGDDSERLYYVLSKDDFWAKPVPPSKELQDNFSVHISKQSADAGKAALTDLRNTGSSGKIAYIGPKVPGVDLSGVNVNPKKLLARLEWNGRFKNPYEVNCIIQAVRSATKGFRSAYDAFLDGGSEVDIHTAFLNGAQITEAGMAFPSIVSLDGDTNFLHRSGKNPNARNGERCLVDAGTTHRGYRSDITATWITDADAHKVYAQLLAGLKSIQQELCAMIKPGLEFTELHKTAHFKIAQLLIDAGIVKNCTLEEAVKKGFTSAFFPHGLGHLLGIQAHEKGGKHAAPNGKQLKPPSDYPIYSWLRKLNPLVKDEAVTIEPGIYFFPPLLSPFKEGPDSPCFNWNLIDQLDGGMRLESDVLVLANGYRDVVQEIMGDRTNV